jgi:hypothetical protein
MNDAPKTFTNTNAFLRFDLFMGIVLLLHLIQIQVEENPVL